MQVTITIDATDRTSMAIGINAIRRLAGLNDVPLEQPANGAVLTGQMVAGAKTTTKKADAPPAEKPAAPPAPEPDPLDDAPKAVTIDRETVRASLKKVQTLDGKDAAVAILKKYGAASMSELKDEHFAAAYADAEANPKVKAAG